MRPGRTPPRSSTSRATACRSTTGNYLIPLDAGIEDLADVPLAGVDAGLILKTLGDAGKRVNIVILDACRNNPFTTRNGEAFNGLARMALARHSYMIFSTFAGAAARDGAGVNSPFAAALADAIAAPGLDLEAAAKNIRLDVAKRTDGTQIPKTWSSLEDAFSFDPHPPDPAADREAAFWHSIEATTHREEYEAYFSRYPDGTFAKLARQRIRDAAPARIASEWPAASFPDF